MGTYQVIVVKIKQSPHKGFTTQNEEKSQIIKNIRDDGGVTNA